MKTLIVLCFNVFLYLFLRYVCHSKQNRSPELTNVSSLRATLMLLLDRKERDRRLHKEISRTDCWKTEELHSVIHSLIMHCPSYGYVTWLQAWLFLLLIGKIHTGVHFTGTDSILFSLKNWRMARHLLNLLLIDFLNLTLTNYIYLCLSFHVLMSVFICGNK